MSTGINRQWVFRESRVVNGSVIRCLGYSCILRELIASRTRLNIGILILRNVLLNKLFRKLRLRLLRARRFRRCSAARIASRLVAKGDFPVDGGGRQALADREFSQKFVLGKTLIGQFVRKRVEHGTLVSCRYAGAIGKERKDILRIRIRLFDDDFAAREDCR